MTGFGRAEESGMDYSVGVEIRSVNNRYLDFQCRVSRDSLHLEPLLRKELGEYVTRGSVTCNLRYESHGAAAAQVSLNEPLFKAYLVLLQRVEKELGSEGRSNAVDLLRIQDLVVPGGGVETPESLAGKIVPVFRKACAELVKAREREGNELAKELEKRLAGFDPSIEKVEKLLPKRQSEYVAKLRERVKDLLDGKSVAEDRVITELGIMAERLDVAEELVRLKAHLGHFRETLHAPSAGKKLGFLLQEMLREVNTLSNKSQYYDIQQICIGWKEDLEIIREQLMNVE